jgi:hypothetical protein
MYSGTVYSGTLIDDLIAAVERAERGAQQRRAMEEKELQRMFELQAPELAERIYAGAA